MNYKKIILLIIILIILLLIIYKSLSYNNIINQTILKGDNICSNIYDYPTANISNTINLPFDMYEAISNYGKTICIVFYTDNIIHCHIKKFNKNIYNKKISLYNIKKITFNNNYNKLDSLYKVNYFNKLVSKNEYKFKQITEKVIKGYNIASTIIDYPTANIINNINLPYGVYKATSNYGESICYVSRPDLIEVHIKNFNQDIYNKKITINNFKKINIDKSYDLLIFMNNFNL